MTNAAKIMGVAGKIVLCLLITLIVAFPLVSVTFAYLWQIGVTDETLLFEQVSTDYVLTIVFGIIQAIAFILATIAVYLLFERRKGWRMGWQSLSRFAETAKGMLIGIVLISLAFASIWMAGGLRVTDFQWNDAVFRSTVLFTLLFAFVAVSEEFFARGYVQGLIKYHFGTWPALAVTSLLFAALHTLNPGAFAGPLPILNLFLAGLLLGVSKEVSGSLWMPIGFHFTWNLFQGSVFGFPVSGMQVASVVVLETAGSDLVSGGGFGAEGSVLTTVILLAGTILLYRLYPRRPREMSPQPQD